MTASTASLPDAVERVAASVVGIGSRRRGIAAGVVWSAGRILTTASALGHASRVHVVRPDGETVIGEVRGTDDSTDLAVIAVATDGLPAIERGEPAAPRVGTSVFAVGRDASGAVHASFGHVGAVGGAWRTWRGGEVDRLVRLDGGLLVTGLGEDGPAARAGLMIGDVLLEADERAVPDLQSLRSALAGERVGTRVPLRILRDGQVVSVGVEVTERRPMSRC